MRSPGLRRSPLRVDDDGLVLPGGTSGSFDVYFGEQHAWSFSIGKSTSPQRRPWPKAMRSYLEGRTHLRVVQSGEVVLEVDHAFGSGEGELSFVDRDGIALQVDKWGLLQRPFAGRDPAVVTRLMDVTEAILATMREDCGLEGWIAFGSLLGAAREGKVIGHDSDVDLAYLSEHSSPAAMMGEMYAITRALRARGMTVVNKSGAFVTVMFDAPDGGSGSVDVYTCFYLGDVLHETATVRTRVPREAVLPLRLIEFEGRMLPAPHDVEAMLAVSYGPGWRVPDPSFSHRPSRETSQRFLHWFGNYWHNRRDWERHHREERGDLSVDAPSGLASYVLEELHHRSDLTGVVDIGCGRGHDVLAYARAGYHAEGIDYARGIFHDARRVATTEQLPARFVLANLHDRRDTLTAGALLAHRLGPDRVVVAGGVWDAVLPMDRDNLLDLVQMLARGDGIAYLGLSTERDPRKRRGRAAGVSRHVATERWLLTELVARGATVTDLADDRGRPRPSTHRPGPAQRWLAATWPERTP